MQEGNETMKKKGRIKEGPKQGRLAIRWDILHQPRGADNNFSLLFLVGFLAIARRCKLKEEGIGDAT